MVIIPKNIVRVVFTLSLEFIDIGSENSQNYVESSDLTFSGQLWSCLQSSYIINSNVPGSFSPSLPPSLTPSLTLHPSTHNTQRLLLIDVLRLSEPFFKQKNPSPQIMIFPSQLKVLSLNNSGCKPEKRQDWWVAPSHSCGAHTLSHTLS